MIEKNSIEVQNERGEMHPLLPTVPCNVVYNEDCMVGLKRFPDNYFDVAIVDPPYGNYKLKENSSSKMFDNIEPDYEYWEQLFRVSKNQIVWGANFFKNVNLSGGGIVWNKLGKDIGRRKQAPTISEAEYAYQSFNNLIKIYSYTWLGNVTGHNYQINSDEFKTRIHPTQKPIELYDWLIKNYCADANLILDTHLGSGSSRIAAHKAGLSFVGFEIDKDYFEAQEKRFKTFTSQLRLF